MQPQLDLENPGSHGTADLEISSGNLDALARLGSMTELIQHKTAYRVDAAGDLAARQAALAEIDAKGILATPANSRYNELVVEAGRLSILNGGREAVIAYEPEPKVSLA